MNLLWTWRMPIFWALVVGGGVLVALVGSGVRIPGIERQIAVSDETRDAAATARAPSYSRQEAIEVVRGFIRAECAEGAAYLGTDPPFEATFMATPFTNDHHERGNMEWTVDDPLTGNKWRFYERTGEVVSVLGDC